MSALIILTACGPYNSKPFLNENTYKVTFIHPITSKIVIIDNVKWEDFYDRNGSMMVNTASYTIFIPLSSKYIIEREEILAEKIE